MCADYSALTQIKLSLVIKKILSFDISKLNSVLLYIQKAYLFAYKLLENFDIFVSVALVEPYYACPH